MYNWYSEISSVTNVGFTWYYTVAVTMHIICINLYFTISAASNETEVPCTPSSLQQILNCHKQADEEDCDHSKEPRTTSQPSAGQ